MKVIVTGASRGIGRGIAEALADRGHSLGLLARSKSDLASAQRSFEDDGRPCQSIACDVRDFDATKLAVTELIERMGGVDAIINNAGLVIRKDVFTISAEEWTNLIDTNVTGVFHTTRAVVPYLREQGSGHVINISSISGKLPLPGGSAYAASKYAVTGFSASLFHELRPFGIKVTTVFPGSVDTEQGSAEGATSTDWKVTPHEVGEACANILETSATNCISELEIRPARKP